MGRDYDAGSGQCVHDSCDSSSGESGNRHNFDSYYGSRYNIGVCYTDFHTFTSENGKTAAVEEETSEDSFKDTVLNRSIQNTKLESAYFTPAEKDVGYDIFAEKGSLYVVEQGNKSIVQELNITKDGWGKPVFEKLQNQASDLKVYWHWEGANLVLTWNDRETTFVSENREYAEEILESADGEAETIKELLTGAEWEVQIDGETYVVLAVDKDLLMYNKTTGKTLLFYQRLSANKDATLGNPDFMFEQWRDGGRIHITGKDFLCGRQPFCQCLQSFRPDESAGDKRRNTV